jgi:hypothetical protein
MTISRGAAVGKAPVRRLGSPSAVVLVPASSITAAATNWVLTEAIWNRVGGVHPAPVSTSAGPAPSSSTTVPALATIAAPPRPSAERVKRS